MLVAVKAVPGATRDEVAGVLGERLKVRVSQPPEDGKANRAILRVVLGAGGTGVQSARHAATVVRGQTRAEKDVRIEGVDGERVLEMIRKLG